MGLTSCYCPGLPRNKGRRGRLFSYLHQSYELQKPILRHLMGTAQSQMGDVFLVKKQRLHGAWLLLFRQDNLLFKL